MINLTPDNLSKNFRRHLCKHSERTMFVSAVAEPAVRRRFLRKWLKCYGDDELDIRNILDWQYYIERLGSAIQKIITIPAALQQVRNPVPRVSHPPWLHKRLLEKDDVLKQKRINEMFQAKEKDIEDLCDPGTSSEHRPVIATVTRKRTRSEDNDENIGRHWKDVLGNPPPMGETGEDLAKWIRFHKRKWAYQKDQRDQLKKLAKRGGRVNTISTSPTATQVAKKARTTGGVATNTLGGFFRKAQQTLLNSPWQVIQVCETGRPGVFKLWVLLGSSELRQIRLVVPRVFYVNQRYPKDNEESSIYRKVMRHLPRAHQVAHLYEYAIDEAVYVHNNDDIAAELANPHIEGIYETQVPLDFRLIATLGCVTKLNKQYYRHYAGESNDTFDMRHLEMCTLAQVDYLEAQCIKYVFMYQHREGQKELVALFIPVTKRAWLYTVDTVRTNQIPNLANMYNQEREAKIGRGTVESAIPGPDYVFESSAESDARVAYKAIQRQLQLYLAEKRGPTLLAVQSALDGADLAVLMPQTGEFPMVRLHVRDSVKMFDHLQWQRLGSKAAIKHFLNVEPSLHGQLEQCRYLHVPIGNLPADATKFGCDIFYARNLLKQNFVWWCSSTDRPDLGGKEADDNRSLEHELHLEVNHEGVYTSACVELELHGLFVTTVLQAHTLAELEGICSNIAFDAVQVQTVQDMVQGGAEAGPTVSGYDESSQCAGAFRILRQMVSAFMKDVAVYKNVFADQQLLHLFRWLKDPHSLLYEPSLKRILDNLIGKMFHQLVAEFQRLGAKVVYANCSRIIVCTKRRSIEDALSYVDFVINSMRNKELFHSIDLTVKQAYKLLLWMDSSNHGGVQETEDSEDEVRMLWNMSKFLSTPSLEESFNMMVGGYINALYQHLQGQEPGAVDNAEKTMKFVDTLIKDEFAQSLMNLTKKLHDKYPTGEFPKNAMMRPTASRVYSPSLEFVKMVTRALSIDSNISEYINNKLKRDLLKLCGVGAFSDAAQWSDPCLSFTLSQVICTHCNNVRDIDLCRDAFMAEGDWFCPMCESNYEKSYIESLLVDSLQAMASAEVLQDVQCTKCNMIKENNMSRHCECAGYYKNLNDAAKLREKLDTFVTMAKTFKMDVLFEAVEWMRAMN